MPAVCYRYGSKMGFNNDYGLVNDFIRRFVPNFQYDWMIHTGSARAAVIAMDLWKDLPFFAILVLSGLQFISGDIYEAAKVDGAGDFRIFWKIILPAAKPLIATIGLFTALTYWNDWYNCMLYITDEDKFMLQYYLQRMLGSAEAMRLVAEKSGIPITTVPLESMKMAMTVIATGPIVLLYPLSSVISLKE